MMWPRLLKYSTYIADCWQLHLLASYDMSMNMCRCQFLVAGRVDDKGKFLRLADVDVPEEIAEEVSYEASNACVSALNLEAQHTPSPSSVVNRSSV